MAELDDPRNTNNAGPVLSGWCTVTADVPESTSAVRPSKRPRPSRQKIGDANYWLEVQHVADAWGLTRRAAFKTLQNLRVPVVFMGSNAYFNSYALDKVLYYVTRHGGPGFAGPGTSAKRNIARRNTISCVMLTDEDLARMEDPMFVAEWLTIRSRGKSASTLIRLLEKGSGNNGSDS